MKISRNYDLLGRAARKVYPVTESERKCRQEQKAMEMVRNRVKERINKHFHLTDDGLVINLK
jgi:hypothetical protein